MRGSTGNLSTMTVWETTQRTQSRRAVLDGDDSRGVPHQHRRGGTPDRRGRRTRRPGPYRHRTAAREQNRSPGAHPLGRCRRDTHAKVGENKVQEAHRKSEEMADLDIDWAVIGHLQSNKAKFVAQFASEFQALDRLKVARALDRRLQGEGRTLDVYVQVNTSAEDSKFGMPPEELLGFLKEVRAFETLKVQGLMTLALFSSDIDRVRPCFQMLRSLRDQVRETDPDLLGPGRLSMGMSGDFEVAIEEGANCVRVGQAIFGKRALPDSYYWPEAD